MSISITSGLYIGAYYDTFAQKSLATKGYEDLGELLVEEYGLDRIPTGFDDPDEYCYFGYVVTENGEHSLEDISLIWLLIGSYSKAFEENFGFEPQLLVLPKVY